MANFNNIVVKKADGTTDVTFVAVTRSAGDKSPARWQQQTGFPIPSQRPALAMASSPAGTSGLVRRVQLDGVYPIVDADGVQIAQVVLKGCQVLTPMNAPVADVSEGVHQLLNCASSAVMKACALEGNAAA